MERMQAFLSWFLFVLLCDSTVTHAETRLRVRLRPELNQTLYSFIRTEDIGESPEGRQQHLQHLDLRATDWLELEWFYQSPPEFVVNTPQGTGAEAEVILYRQDPKLKQPLILLWNWPKQLNTSTDLDMAEWLCPYLSHFVPDLSWNRCLWLVQKSAPLHQVQVIPFPWHLASTYFTQQPLASVYFQMIFPRDLESEVPIERKWTEENTSGLPPKALLFQTQTTHSSCWMAYSLWRRMNVSSHTPSLRLDQHLLHLWQYKDRSRVRKFDFSLALQSFETKPGDPVAIQHTEILRPTSALPLNRTKFDRLLWPSMQETVVDDLTLSNELYETPIVLNMDLITQGTAFHPKLNIYFNVSSPSNRRQDSLSIDSLLNQQCRLEALLALTWESFFDVYQLRDFFESDTKWSFLSPAITEKPVDAGVHGLVELEAPAHHPLSRSMLLSLRVPLRLDGSAVEVPFHMRYLPPKSHRKTNGSYQYIPIPRPIDSRLFCGKNWRVVEDEGFLQPLQWKKEVNKVWSPVSFSQGTYFFRWIPSGNGLPVEWQLDREPFEVRMPVGNLDNRNWVLAGTVVIVIGCTIYSIHALLSAVHQRRKRLEAPRERQDTKNVDKKQKSPRLKRKSAKQD